MCTKGGFCVAEQKNRVSVQIYGHTYNIVGPESTGHMRLVATMVDEKMREINTQIRGLDTKQLAVLTAVNAIHENLKLKEQLEQFEEELKKLKG